jgi:hypothetical protein
MKSVLINLYKKTTAPLVHGVMIITLGLILAACNNSDDQFSPGTNVTIAPTEFVWTVTEVLDNDGQCIYFEDFYQDNIMRITVADGGGRPIGDMKLELYLSPSSSTSNPAFGNQHIFYLYDDFNNNGVVDHPEELVSGAGEPILYETETDEYHGTKTVIVRTNTSCSGYKATLHAYAGDGYNAMEIRTELEDTPAGM